MSFYELSSRMYLSRQSNCYKRIITINKEPDGPLQQYVKQLQHNKLSIFDIQNECDSCYKNCFYGILDPHNKNDLLCLDNITNLFQFLLSNNYQINTEITKLMIKNKRINSNDNLIAYITYC